MIKRLKEPKDVHNFNRMYIKIRKSRMTDAMVKRILQKQKDTE